MCVVNLDDDCVDVAVVSLGRIVGTNAFGGTGVVVVWFATLFLCFFGVHFKTGLSEVLSLEYFSEDFGLPMII